MIKLWSQLQIIVARLSSYYAEQAWSGLLSWSDTYMWGVWLGVDLRMDTHKTSVSKSLDYVNNNL
jgi:hypothetical protein